MEKEVTKEAMQTNENIDAGGAAKQRLFVDMDGTLAVFRPVDRLETLYEKNYFLNLEPQENVLEAVRILARHHPGIDIYIMSAVLSDSTFALPEKNEWLDWHLPEIDREHRIFPSCGKDKKEYISDGIRETDFLLDDYTHNLCLWEPPARGIKLLNGINHTKGTWKKEMVSHNTPPAELAESIAFIMTKERTIKENLTLSQTIQFIQKTNADIAGLKRYCRYVPDTEGMQPLTLAEAREAMKLGIAINYVNNWEEYHGTWSGYHATYPFRDEGQLHRIYSALETSVYSRAFIAPEYNLINTGLALKLKQIIENSLTGFYKESRTSENRQDSHEKKEKKVKPKSR